MRKDTTTQYPFNTEIRYLAKCQLENMVFKFELIADKRVRGVYDSVNDLNKDPKFPFSRVFMSKLTIRYIIPPHEL